MSQTDPSATRAPRRRGRGLIVTAVVVAILIVLVVVADNVARSIAQNAIAEKLRSALSLSADAPVDVTVGGASVLLQLVSGRLDDVDVAAKNVTVGSLSGDATLSATGVPLDSSKTITAAQLKFTASQGELEKLLAGYSASSSVPIKTVAVAKGAVDVGTEFSILGITLPVSVALKPSAVDGELALTPTKLTVRGATFTPAQVRNTFGSIADTVLATQKICVASYLPKSLTLDSITVVGSSVRLGVSGTALPLDDSLLKSKGTCP